MMAVREALHGKSLTPKGGFDNHDRHGVCQASFFLLSHKCSDLVLSDNVPKFLTHDTEKYAHHVTN